MSMCVNWVIPPSEVDLMEMCLEGGAEGVEEVLAGEQRAAGAILDRVASACGHAPVLPS